MKISAVLLLVACLQVSASGFSQRVTLSKQNVPLKQVFRDIESQTGFQFFYKERLIKQSGTVSVHVQNSSIDEALQQCFQNLPLTWLMVDKVIVIKEKPHSPADNINTVEVAPTQQVKGKVTDRQGNALAGVSVVLKGGTRGTSTDLNGNFSLDAKAGNVLEFSIIGYKSVSVTIPASLQVLVKLEMEATMGNEIVVVGYGTQKKSDVTGSVVSLSSKDFTEGTNSNALQLLNGRAAGVNISQVSSAPGDALKIQIRGAGSINSSNQALVVVDGLPGVDPSFLSPDDIQSIEILKDASAAAIYGTRAANGVVLITTKTGKKGEPVVRYGTYLGTQSVAKKVNVLNGRQYMETLNALRQDAGQPLIYTQDQIDKVGEGTNWQNEIFNTAAPVQNHQLSISGGSDKSDYYAGVNFFNQKGLVRNSDYKKFNLRANMNFKAKEFLRFKLNMNFTRSYQNSILTSNAVNENAGPINSAIQFDPTLPATLDANGRYYGNSFIALDNPLALINGYTDNSTGSNFYGVFTTEIEPVKNLVGSVRLGGTLASDMNSSYRDRSTMNGLGSGGIGSKGATDYAQWLAEFLLRYSRDFGKDHSVSVMGGATFEEFLTQSVGASSRGFLSDVTSYNLLQSGDNDNGDNVSSSKDRNRLNGFIGRLNYGFRDKYLLTASFRVDGTSRFSDAHKYAFFPSGAFAWKIMDEPFMNRYSHIFNDLKLRVGYGKLGNQGIGNYQTLQTLVAGGSAVFGNTIYQGVVPARLPNRDLRWEATEEINAGIDFSVAHNRITGSLDYYIRNTKDQLFNKPLPSVVGYTSILVNVGNVQNRGWDFMINTVNIDRKDFKWQTSLNFSTLTNEVRSLPPFIPQLISGNVGSFINNYLITTVGSPIQSFYGYETEGIFQTQDEVANSSQPNAKPGQIRFKDQDKNGSIGPEDRVILGDPFPDFTGGISNRFTYKNFSLDVFFQWVKGIQTLDANVLESLYPTNEYRNRIAKYYENRWTPTNPSNTYPSGVNPSAYGGAYAINSLTIQDASFARLKTVNLTYNIPLRNKNVLQSAQVYVAADNVFTFTKYEGFDPDANATGSNGIAKVNYNSYPLARSIRFGLNVTF